MFASFLAIARSETTAAFVPRALTLRRTAPQDVSEHERLFRIGPIFGASEDALVLIRDLLGAPLRSANAALAATVERFAEQQLAHTPSGDSATVTPRVRACLAPEIAGGTPSIRAASRQSRRKKQIRSAQRWLS